jgi:predicted enzyme related to lactoylglutathione lyase
MGWLPFVGVPDAHRTVEQAKSLGARILTDVSSTPAGGEWAVLADPQGAVFAIYASAGEEGSASGGESSSGEFSWHELGTSDYKAALEFYSALFGWTLDGVHDMGEMGDYALFSAEGRQVGGMYNNLPHEGHTPPPGWLCYVKVDRLEPAIESATGAGGTVLLGPMDVPGGSRIAMLLDPDGMRFALHQPPRKAQSVGRKSAASAPGRSAAKKSPAKKSAAKKSPAKKSPATKSGAKKSGANKSAGRKPASQAGKKSVSRNSVAGKSASKKSGAAARRRAASKTGRNTTGGGGRRSGASSRGKASGRGTASTRAKASRPVKRGRGTRSPARKSSGRGRRGRR